MIKKKKSEKDKEETEQKSSETTGAESVNEVGETTHTESHTEVVAEVKKIDRCTLSFPNEDLNKLVEYMNKLAEAIEKL